MCSASNDFAPIVRDKDSAQRLSDAHGDGEIVPLYAAPQPAQVDAPAEARKPAAWVTPDGDRAITQRQKQAMLLDGGASASSVRAYSIPCYADSAPADAGEARLTDEQRVFTLAAKHDGFGDRKRFYFTGAELLGSARALLNGADHA